MTAQDGAGPGGDLAWLLDDRAGRVTDFQTGPHLVANPRFPAIPIAVE
jgi:hypothetical protein